MIRAARAVALVWGMVAVLGSAGAAVAIAAQPVVAAVTPAVTTAVYSYDAGVNTSDSSFVIGVASVAAWSWDGRSAAMSSGGLTARPTVVVAAETAGTAGRAALDTTPAGRLYSSHYLNDTGAVRNIPGSVVDETIDYGQVAKDLPDRTVFYDPTNDVTVVESKTTGKIMSVRRGAP